MSATIIPFPSRPADRQRLTLVGDMLGTAIPLPVTEDNELKNLLAIGGKLLDNLNSYQRPDCSRLMDEWLNRLDAWDARSAG